MINERLDGWLDKIPYLDKAGHTVSHTIHNTVLNGGEQVRNWVDLLHGTWLGHPLHPVLIEVVIGAWGFATVFDLLSLTNRSKHAESAADTLLTIGNYAAVPTILSGLADYSTIPHPATRAGLVHAAINGVGFMLQLSSAAARKEGARPRAIALSSLATILLTGGAYLGGHLVYDKKVGVKHSEPAKEPQTWTSVLDAGELQEGAPQRVEVEGNPVLLYRQDNTVQAIGAVCPHAGGPLEEGKFFAGCVQCPWHDSVFDLSNGRVVHGPATYAVPNYEARIREGQVEVRLVAPDQ